MSTENTNTPNGFSKNLYSLNQDINKQELDITDMSQKNPEIDLTGKVVGDNTETTVNVRIDNTVAIQQYGSVRIEANLVNQPIKFSPEARNIIKNDMKQIKEAILKRKGVSVMTNEDYIAYKKEKIANKEEKTEKDDETK